MTTPRAFARYPTHYKEAFFNAINAPFPIPCQSKKHAKLLRAHLYAFRTAAFNELPEGEDELIILLSEAKTKIENKTLIIYYNTTNRRIADAVIHRQRNRSDLPVKD